MAEYLIRTRWIETPLIYNLSTDNTMYCINLKHRIAAVLIDETSNSLIGFAKN